jgi:Zn-dependent protease
MHKIHHRTNSPEQPAGPPTPPVTASGTPYRRPRISFRPSAVFGWLFVTFILASGPLEYAVPDQSGSAYFSAAALGGLAVLGALLGAELRRARQLERAGLHVDRVELGLLRARTIAAGEVSSPTGLRRVSWAGPLTLGASALVLAVAGGLLSLGSSASFSLLGATALFTAAGIASLAVTELIPAPGSPGSQLVFAHAWRRSGQREAAVLSTARAGVVSGWILMAAGIALVIFVSFAGIWLTFIGGVTIAGSRLTVAGARTRQRLAGLRASDVMSPAPPEVSSFATAGAAFADVAMPSRVDLLLVREPDGSFGGVVSVRALAAVPGDDRELVRVRRLAIPPSAVATVTASDPIEHVRETMARHPLGGVAVVLAEPGAALDKPASGSHAAIVGVVSPADVARTIELMDAANPGGKRARSGRPYPFG